MSRTRRHALGTSIHSTLFLTVFSVVLTGLVLHGILMWQGIERLRQASVVTTAELLLGQWRAELARSPEDLQRACARLLEHPSAHVVCAWDQAGTPAAWAAAEDDWLQLIEAQRRSSQDGTLVQRVEMPSDSVMDGGDVRYVEIGLGSSQPAGRATRLGLLLTVPVSAPGVWEHVLFFYAPMTLVGLAAFLWGSRRLRVLIVHPIALLAKTAKDQTRQDAVSQVDREDELGGLARSLAELQEGLSTWRNRAELIERRMDFQIAAETRRITQDLRRVQRDAWLDPLTGVKNRRMLEEKFQEIFTAQREQRQDLSVAMLDLDHFKTLNDTLGHGAGDEILAFAGELFRQCLRADDIVIRYGGDEFVLILPGVSVEEAQMVIQRIIALYTQRTKMLTSVRPVPTMSAGIASLHHNAAADPDEILALADRGLYEAKRAGKGKVCICETRSSVHVSVSKGLSR